MTVVDLLRCVESYGGSIWVENDRLELDIPDGFPETLIEKLRDHKAEVIDELTCCYGDGLLPPLERPPQTEQELRRWMDYTADPKRFAERFDWAMTTFDPSEDLQQGP